MNYKGDEQYTPMSSFMTFGNYRVESRERVKLISGVEGQFLVSMVTPCAGLGNLSSKIGSETVFPAQNLDRLLDRDFQGLI